MRKSFLAIVMMYGMIFASLFYWQICVDLQSHPANPRYYQLFKEERGVIFDRHGVPLALSTSSGESYVRKYETASLSHVLGYFHPRYGMTGLERLYNEDLSLGRSLITTLDLRVQRAAETALGNRRGAVLVMKPDTGEVLALVSAPWVDANALDTNWSDYLADVRSPFLNRVTHGLYPPGSTLKPIVYGAALGEQLVQEDQRWQDQGSLVLLDRTITNFGGKALGDVTTDQALAFSSNVVFAQLAISLGDRLLDEFGRFGLGKEVAFELQNLAGYIPSKVQSDYDAAQLGIGQGELLVTPLQMARVVSTIANGGVLMQPFVVQEVRGGLRMRQITRPAQEAEVVTPSVARRIQGAMELAATEGTAQSKPPVAFDYGGKTGTAQMGLERDHAWFIGFAPADNPEVVVAVVVDYGGFGSEVAVPIGVQAMATALGFDQ